MQPSKLCDFNKVELKNCGNIPKDFVLRIPNNTCEVKRGAYECLTV